MVQLTSEQAEAFIEYARTVLERANTPPVEDAARILSFVEGATADYVNVRRHTSQSIAAAIMEGFMAGRAYMSPIAPGHDDDDDYNDAP